MQPIIKTAEHQISFKLTDEYIASAYADVESMGEMQYLHYLVVHGPEKMPEFFVCAEWLDHNTLNKNGPVLGVFSSTGHGNMGYDKQWLDINLFILKAVELARVELELDDDGLSEGEAWALTNVLKKIQCLSEGSTSQYLSIAYLDAMSKNGARLVAYLQKSNCC